MKAMTLRSLLTAWLLLVACWWEARAGEPARVESAAADETIRVYVGTYTRGQSEGIYQCRLDRAAGCLSSPTLAGRAVNPSFLAIGPRGRCLYAVGEMADFGGQRSGAISAFRMDPQTGALALINRQPSGGRGPCHLTVDPAGKNVLVANYGSGSVAVVPIRDDGGLAPPTAQVQHTGSSVHPRRQTGPHAHGIYVDPTGRFAMVPDLGLDKILVYRFDAGQGTLTANEPAWAAVEPGSGPRHLAFHPGGRFAYVINEMASTITAFAYDGPRGTLAAVQTVSTLPDEFTGENTTAEIAVHPSGKYLYGSNRGHDSIVALAIDPQTGKLSLVGHEPTQGKTPRNFGIDPSGTLLLAANQNSHTIVVFRIDPQSGRLRPTGSRVEVPSPVCVEMMRAK